MPLAECPWMVARCPHYTTVCDDPDSQHCMFVKSNTFVASATLRAMQAAKRSGPSDPDLERSIRDLEDFLSGSVPGSRRKP